MYDRLPKDAARGPKFLLVDACRNDPKQGRGRGIDADTAPTPPRGVGVLLSCSAGETAWEHKDFGGGHGAFFHHVIEGLKGKGVDDEGNVTWDSLRAYVKRPVARDVPKVLKEGATQTPEESGRLAGVPPVLVAAQVPPPSKKDAPPGGKNYVSKTTGMKFARVPKGTFTTGDDNGSSDEKPARRVTLTKDYYLGVYEVTQGALKAVMGTTLWQGKEYVKEGDDYPATYVSWDDAVELTRRLSDKDGRAYRLPTEAEWERACRAGGTAAYHFGASADDLGDYAWFDKNARDVGEKYAHRVGGKKPNAYGLYDVNVKVW